MRTFSVREARTHLSRLVDHAARGESFVIAKSGKPSVKVTRLDAPSARQRRRLGFMVGEFTVPDDFDRMGSEEIAHLFGPPGAIGNDPTALVENLYAHVRCRAMLVPTAQRKEITVGILNPGITPANAGDGGTVWNILGQTYYMKETCDTSFSFEVHGMPDTFVPAHIHPTQDEFIYLLDGEMELTLDGQKHALHTGEMARMPMGIPHAYANAGATLVRALFWVTPGRKLHELFTRLHDLTDVAEVVRISAECEVNFLPPPG